MTNGDSFSLSWLLWSLLGLFLVLGIFLVWRFRQLRQGPPSLQQAPSGPPLLFRVPEKQGVSRLLYKRLTTIQLWQDHLRDAAGVWGSGEYGALFLVHGTFVGTDPLSLLESLSQWIPQSQQAWILRFGQLVRGGTDRLARDLGNFSLEYQNHLAAVLGIPVRSVVWSSANHHAARMFGSLTLLQQILNLRSQLKDRSKLMLWGHSHAGQLFALVSQMVWDETRRGRFGELMGAHGQNPLLTDEDWTWMQTLELDFVTFGTPVRYSYCLPHKWRLLSIVNDRSISSARGIDFAGSLFTKEGDYIQHWARAGSDITVMNAKLRSLNRLLDPLLDEGVNLRLLECLADQRRNLQPVGINALVDYDDGSTKAPNCLNTMFGHGTYTRYLHLPYNLLLISHLLRGTQAPDQFLLGKPKGAKIVRT